MANTPFIDALPKAQKQTVRQKARGVNRPSYFSAQQAKARAMAKRTGDVAVANIPEEVQISEDLEAVLILMPIDVKKDLLDFIGVALSVSLTQDDLALMEEIVEVRATNYQQANADVGSHLSQYTVTRNNIISFVAKAVSAAPKGTQVNVDPSSVVVPDMNALFAVLKDDHAGLSSLDLLAAHDRITDSATLYSYLDAGTYRGRELFSWAAIVMSYL
jgi:hypothetical protein